MLSVGTTIMLLASWYGPGFHGRITASGTTYNKHSSTAAHKSLPFGTRLRVCHQSCEVVTITDRGPYIAPRELDLSQGTAERIGMIDQGVANVEVTRLN